MERRWPRRINVHIPSRGAPSLKRCLRPIADAVAEPDTIAVHTVTDAVAVADALWWYIHTHDRHRCDHSTGYRFGTGQQL